jgi:polyphosphate glucokinase
MNEKRILGVDIGGSGIKGAIIDTKTGEMLTERHRIDTPSPATPTEVALVLKELVKRFSWKGGCGCGFPAVIQKGVARTAANIDKSFIGTNVDKLFSEVSKCKVFTINDADAAGMAEMKFGAGRKQDGIVILITVGTGLGTVIFSGGKLLPNTELGHIILKNAREAEHFASDAIRKNEDLSWKDWGLRFNEYLRYMEDLFWPDLFIIGGGVSKKEDQFRPQLTTRTPVVMAQQKNYAGMVGAAVYARLQL